MSEGLSLEARIEFLIQGLGKAVNDINDVITGIASFGEVIDDAGGNTDNFERTLVNVTQRLKSLEERSAGVKAEVSSLGTVVQDANDDVNRSSKEWEELASRLALAQQAYRDFRQEQLTGVPNGVDNSGNPTFAQSPLNLPALEQYKLLDTAAAQSANAVAELRTQEEQLNRALADQARIIAANDWDRQIAELGEVEAWTRRLADAEAELSAAQMQRARLTSASSIGDEAFAQQRVASALDEQRTAQQGLNRAIAATSNSTAEYADSRLPRLRYALYDVSNVAAITGAALLAAFSAPIVAAVAFEKDFARVQRTAGVTGEAARSLRAEFVALSQEMPVAFSELTEIGTLAAQFDIAASSLANFTSVTSRFASSTGLTVDASATAMARLGQLLPGVGDDYEALASSILKVGVNSVATEQQIIAISQNIAGVATTVGLTTDEVIGLAGALASIGTAPEAARGTVTRLFTRIQTAISGNVAGLQKLAALAGMTGEEFRKAFKADAGGTLVALLEGINATGDGAIQVLRGLGLQGARDIPTLLKLSQNTELFKSTLEDASSGLIDATTLSEHYGVTSQTVAARLQILVNSLTALVASAGQVTSGPLRDAIDLFADMVQWLTRLTDSPAGQWFVGIATVAGLAAAGIALLSAATARGAGSFLAYQTATLEARAALAAMQAQNTATAASTKTMEVALRSATWASNGLKAALVSTGVGIGLLAVGGIITWLMDMAGAFDTASSAAERFFGDTSSLRSAFARDTQVFEETGEAIRTWRVNVESASTAASPLADSVRTAITAQDDLTESTDRATSALRTQVVAYGENAKAALAQALAQNETLKELFGDTERMSALQGLGFDGSDFIRAILGDPERGAAEYIARLEAELDRQVRAGIGAGSSTQSGDMGLKLAEALGSLDTVAAGTSQLVQGLNSDLSFLQVVADGAGTSLTGLADGTLDAGDVLGWYGDELKYVVDNISAVVNTNAELASSLQGIGQQFADSGAAAALSGDAMQRYIQTILTSAPNQQAAADSLQALANSIINSGYAASMSSPSLQYLASVITALGGSQTKATVDMSAFTSGMRSAGGAAGGAAKQVRTLVDYGRDLASVFDRSFELRFGRQQSLDDITSGWRAIADAADDARRRITEATNEILKLSADKQTLEYYLQVARLYKDTARIAEIEARLAENAADTADAHKDLADAQDDASTSLTGNSKAAIQNRETILGMIQGYQDLLATYAATGMSQADLEKKSAQLKKQFIDQAVQLGYSKTEVSKYAKAFDDAAAAINRVPRNITVSANTNPAMQALAEYEARLKKMGGTKYSGGTIKAPTFDKSMDDRLQTAAKVEYYRGVVASLSRRSPVPMSALSNAASSLDSWVSKGRKLGMWYDGGFTGGGNPRDIAGFVHGREFVFSAPAVRNLGVSNLAHLHERGKRGYATGGPVGMVASTMLSGSSGPVMVQLTPRQASALDRIADGVERGMTINDGVLAYASGNASAAQVRRGGN